MTLRQWFSGIDWSRDGPRLVALFFTLLPAFNLKYDWMDKDLLSLCIGAFTGAGLYIMGNQKKE